jgi:hypothetical protein
MMKLGQQTTGEASGNPGEGHHAKRMRNKSPALPSTTVDETLRRPQIAVARTDWHTRTSDAYGSATPFKTWNIQWRLIKRNVSHAVVDAKMLVYCIGEARFRINSEYVVTIALSRRYSMQSIVELTIQGPCPMPLEDRTMPASFRRKRAAN